MKKLLMISGLIAVFAIASAMPTFTKVFTDNYKVKADSTLGKAKCSVCHTTMKGGKLNLYGLDLQKEMKAAKTKKLTPAILKKVESLDSDKDKIKNIDEIKKDQLPGGKPKES